MEILAAVLSRISLSDNAGAPRSLSGKKVAAVSMQSCHGVSFIGSHFGRL
jgi:hypothetical protein